MNRAILLAALAGATIVASGCTSGPSADYSAFTACLRGAGVQEYGAYWCPNCARVKLTLGDAWRTLDYVECDPKCVRDASGALPDFCNGFESQTSACLAKGVEKYPTWMRGGQIIYVGTDLDRLSGATGCPLPA